MVINQLKSLIMPTNKIILKNAIVISLLIAGFFFVSKLFGLEKNSYLRAFNLVFVAFGTYLAIKENVTKNGEISYFNNFGVGIQTSTIAVIVSIIGLILYVEIINPSFFTVLSNSFLIAGTPSIQEFIMTLFIEGIASSVISSFIIMQYYKNYKIAA